MKVRSVIISSDRLLASTRISKQHAFSLMKPNIIYSFPIQNQFILSIVSALRVAFRATLAVLVLGCITSVSSAQTWTGNTSANWDTTTSGNWNGGIPSAADAGDYVYFNAPPASGNGTTTPINLSVGYSPGDLNVIYFYGTAYTGSTGYTIDASNSGNLGVSVIDLAPSFDGSGITETVNAPITAGAGGQNGGNVYLENYAPLTANSAYPIAFGGTGYNDTLAIGGSVTFTDTSSNSSYTLNLLGTGNGSISGNITQNLARRRSPEGGLWRLVMPTARPRASRKMDLPSDRRPSPVAPR
jgi:hypothetical protein